MGFFDKPELGVVDFGRQLLITRDLDPVYVMLHKGNLEIDLLKKWILAYICFYHVGVASYIASEEALPFWSGMITVAKNVDLVFPRGTERRHFRGQKAIDAVLYLSALFPNPSLAIDALIGEQDHPDGLNFVCLTRQVKVWPLFGPWIAFKVADIIDRVLGIPVDIDSNQLTFYKEPLAGAEIVAKQLGIVTMQDWELLEKVVKYLQDVFKDYLAPPFFDRPIGPFEVETILCKYKAHLNGYYPLGKDTREVRHALETFRDKSELAKHLDNSWE